MDKFFHSPMTVIESALAVVGIHATYERPHDAVVERFARGVEIRAYDGHLAVETDARGQGDGEAFGRLFRYISERRTCRGLGQHRSTLCKVPRGPVTARVLMPFGAVHGA